MSFSMNHYCLLIDQSVFKLLKKEINRVQKKTNNYTQQMNYTYSCAGIKQCC